MNDFMEHENEAGWLVFIAWLASLIIGLFGSIPASIIFCALTHMIIHWDD